MLPKKGHSVEKKYFLYSIIKIYDVNCYLKLKKNIFCNLTIFELVNRIGDFELLCYVVDFRCTCMQGFKTNVCKSCAHGWGQILNISWTLNSLGVVGIGGLDFLSLLRSMRAYAWA